MATERICAASRLQLSRSAARFSSRVAMIERKCASESETRRNRLSELITGSVPLAKPRGHIVAARPYAPASFCNCELDHIWQNKFRDPRRQAGRTRTSRGPEPLE